MVSSMPNYRENAPWLEERKKHAHKNYLVSVTMSISIPTLVEEDEEHFDNSGRQMKEALPQVDEKLFYTLYNLRKEGWNIDEKEVIVDPEQPEKVVYEHVDSIEQMETPEGVVTCDDIELELLDASLISTEVLEYDDATYEDDDDAAGE